MKMDLDETRERVVDVVESRVVCDGVQCRLASSTLSALKSLKASQCVMENILKVRIGRLMERREEVMQLAWPDGENLDSQLDRARKMAAGHRD